MCMVDLATGRLSLSAVDFELGGRIPLLQKRHYRSSNLWLGDLGHGWAHPYGVRLWTEGDTLWFRGSDGRRIPFSRPAPGRPSVQPSERTSLHHFPVSKLPWPKLAKELNSGVLVIQISTSPTLLFDARPQGKNHALRGIVDRSENLLEIIPGSDGLPASVLDQWGRRLIFLRNSAGLLAEIQLIAGTDQGGALTLVHYEYDLMKDLVRVHDLAGTRIYEYREHVLIRHYDRCGGMREASFDSQKRCIHTSGCGGALDRFYEYEPEKSKTTVRDSLRASTVYLFDDKQKLLQTIDRAGGKSTFDYDAEGRLVRATNQMGQETTFCFDRGGRQVAKVSPDGSATAIETDSLGEVTKIQYPSGALSEFERNSLGQAVQIVRSGRGTTRVTYAKDGSIESLLIPSGKTVRYSWSPDGRILKESDDEGVLTEQHFDWLGRLVLLRNALGATTRYRYDKAGHLSQILYPDNSARKLKFDAEGRLLEFVDESGSQTQWSYDRAGRCIANVLPSGEAIRCEYDSEKRLLAILGPDGLWHRYVYDARGLVVSQQFSDGRVEEYSHDPSGLLRQMRDPTGAVIEIERDPVGHLSRVRFPDGVDKIVEHDLLGNWIRSESGGHCLTRELGPGGQAVVENQDDFVIYRKYGSAGELLSELDTLGRKVLYSYDKDGRAVEIQVTLGKWSEGDWSPESTPEVHRFEYDRVDNLVLWIMPSGKTERRKYDLRRRLIEQSISFNGREVLRREYTYDGLGRITVLRDSARGAVEFEYDRMSRLIKVRRNGRITHSYQYTSAGDVLADHWEYLPGHKTKKVPGYGFQYDRRGFTIRRSSAKGTDEFSYHIHGLLTGCRLADRSEISYQYDPHYRLVSKTAGSEQTRYYWNQDNLWGMRNGAVLSQFLYLPGTRTPLEQRVGTRAFSIHTNPVGSVLDLLDENGNLQWTGPADPYGAGRPANSPKPGEVDCPFGFPGQLWDSATGFFYNRYRYYCPESAHYLTPDPIGIWGGLDAFRYVPDPINLMDPMGLECRNKTDDDILYRGDARPPDMVCKDGFTQSNPSANVALVTHANGTPDTGSNWISTSYDTEVADRFAVAADNKAKAEGHTNSGPYVYVISNPGCGEEVDCDPGVKEWEKKYNLTAESEKEIAFNKPIPPTKIVGYYRADQGMASFQGC